MDESSFVIDIKRTNTHYKLEIFASGDIVNSPVTFGVLVLRKYFKNFNSLLNCLDKFFRKENIQKVIANEKYARKR